MLSKCHTISSRRLGLKINREKAKILKTNAVNQRHVIMLEGVDIEIEENYGYLGQIISLQDSNQSKEIQRRIQLGWAAFGRLSHIFRSKLPLCFKKNIFNSCVLPTMTYGAETWTTTKNMSQMLFVAQRAIERIMLGITRKDRLRNTVILQLIKVEDVIQHIKRSKWKWVGHLYRMYKDRWARTATEWTPRKGRRSQGHPPEIWHDDLKRWAGRVWGRAAGDRQIWRSRVDAFSLQWADTG